ncbi:MAG: hypothetical protein QNJ85_12275 [Gammaproteobacteria bacterium]|nr:hypothetical protein [Gammaproteobacteria bacterium]
MKSLKLLLPLLLATCLLPGARAELQDQGLNSIMLIIDKAIEELGEPAAGDDGAADPAATETAVAAIVNLSRTLGTLSYSRLQCGEAGVLAEFTRRVQLMPDENRDAMRDAFQEGFDKSKEETPLLSQDECERLTRSRNRGETEAEANVKQEQTRTADAPQAAPEPEREAAPAEEPKQRHMRIAEMSGQLAYKRRFCEDEAVFNRDYNEYLESVPEDFREEAKQAYWKGYKHGERLNKFLTREQCPNS